MQTDAQLFVPEALYCVLGWPLSQSLSPLLHNIGFQTLGIQAVYMKFAVEPEHLAAMAQSIRTLPIAGVSVTIPFKSAIIPYLDDMTQLAKKVGAVNTLFWDEKKLIGDNTDCLGFIAPLVKEPISDMRILILGAGGAARAALCALIHHKAKNIALATPSNKSHLALAQEFGAKAILWDERYNDPYDLIVNATPLGMHGMYENETPFDFDKAQHIPSLAYDIVYNPLKTRFLQQAQMHGVTPLYGRDMFFEQGNAQFRRWTGRDLPIQAKKAFYDKLLSL